MKLVVFAGATLITAGLWVSGLRAHAFLERANPPVGSSVAQAPPEVRLAFTENLEPRFSRAELTSAAGARIATGGVDRQRPNELVIRVPGLKPGLYRVRWRVISVDTHATEGDFTFEVKP